MIGTGLGLTDWLAIDLDFAKDAPMYGVVKFQFMGAPKASAGQGNFSLGAKWGYGLLVAGAEIPEEEVRNGPQVKRTYTVDMAGSYIELSTGYRILAPLIVYAGYYKETYQYTASFQEGVADTIKHEGKQKGYHLGVGYSVGRIEFKFNISKSSHSMQTSSEVLDKLDWGLGLSILI
jgi:hypothetical protein